MALGCGPRGNTLPSIRSILFRERKGSGSRPPVQLSCGPTHHFQRRFGMPPRFGLLAFTLLFEGESLLSDLGNGSIAVAALMI
jgi:hypothetical protein